MHIALAVINFEFVAVVLFVMAHEKDMSDLVTSLTILAMYLMSGLALLSVI
jgi:hypothetical protein